MLIVYLVEYEKSIGAGPLNGPGMASKSAKSVSDTKAPFMANP
jgi:hypothetical protein